MQPQHLDISAWFSKSLSPSPLLTWQPISTENSPRLQMCRSLKMPQMPSKIRVLTPEAARLVCGERIGIRRPGLSSCVTLSSSLYSLGCFLLSRARGLMCLILEASHEFRLLWILWRNLSLKYQLLVQSSQAGIDQLPLHTNCHQLL